MATNPSTLIENAGRLTPPDANYTYGSARNDSTGTSGDGTPIKEAVMNDVYGLQQAILLAAGIVPSGNADTVLASQYLQGLVEQAMGRAANVVENGTVGDAYAVSPAANNQAPQTLFDGLSLEATFAVPNTGAATLNVASLGAKSIAGTATAGALPAGTPVWLRYNLLADEFVIVQRFDPALASPVTQGVHSIWMPAEGMRPVTSVTGAAAGVYESPTLGVETPTIDFDAGVSRSATFRFKMPKSGSVASIKFIPVWSHLATTTNFDARWSLAAEGVDDGGSLNVSFPSAPQVVVDTGGAVDTEYRGAESAAVVIGGSPSAEATVYCQMTRTGADVADTLNAVAQLHGVMVLYTVIAGDDS